MIIKINLTVDINPDTLECKILKQETSKPSAKKVDIDDNDLEPKIFLTENKYIINKAAAQLMDIKPEDKLAIRYLDIKSVNFPVIGKQEAYGIHSGNKVTKSMTVSCRGVGRDKLAEFGTVFVISKVADRDGLFAMVGDSDKPEMPPDKIDTSEADREEDIDLDSLNAVIEQDDLKKEQDDSYAIDKEVLSI